MKFKHIAFLVWIIFRFEVSAVVPSQITIGIIFRATNTWNLLAGELAVDDVNNDPTILPDTRLALLTNITENSKFNILQNTCYLLEQNVVTIIGPSSSTHIKVAHSPIGNLRVPHLAPTATDPTLSFTQAGQSPYPSLIKMTPPDSFQMAALTTFMLKFKWKAIAVIAESTDYGLNGLIELQRIATSRNIAVVSAETFIQTKDPENLDVTDILLDIRGKGVRIVTLHCIIDYAKVILRQAHQLGMLKKGWAWLVTDGVTLSGGQALFEPNGKIPDYLTGIIGTQPSLQENLLLKKMKQDLEVKVRRTVDISELPAAARVYDAVLAAAYGLHSLISHQHFSAPSFPPGVCSNATVNHWNDGKELFRSILEIQNVKGLQGNLEFNDFGFYSNIAYSLVNLETTGFTEIGNWTMSHGFEELKITSAPLFPGEIKSPPGDAVYELTNKTIRVVVLEEPPFVMKNQEYDPKDPQSQRYIGYCMDLLMELQTLFNFQYTLYEVRQYGRKHPITKRWNGLVKELLDDRADIAVTSFTISHEREKVITFTKPFFDLGQTILLPRRNLQVSNTLFAFLSPFDTLLWMLIIISTVGASLATYFCQNFTPDNYQKRMLSSIHKSHCPVAKMNQATGIPLSEALWLGFSSLVNQTIDPGFINFPARVVVGVWWFTNVVLISAYTAKLAAVFTSERLVTEIKSIEDLVTQGAIDYGTVENSVVHEFFATHQMELFRIAFQNMRNKDTFVHTAGDGIKRVRQTSSIPLGASGRYAFIFDSPVLDFASQQEPCNTETVGLFAPQNYGFGLQKDSPYEEKFSLGILKLKKEGFFEMLYERWFKGICSHVIASQGKSENYQLAFNAMIGVFSCLSGGIGISLLVVAGSWLVIYMKEMRKEKKRRMRVYPDNCSYPTERLDREEAIWASVTGRQ